MTHFKAVSLKMVGKNKDLYSSGRGPTIGSASSCVNLSNGKKIDLIYPSVNTMNTLVANFKRLYSVFLRLFLCVFVIFLSNYNFDTKLIVY